MKNKEIKVLLSAPRGFCAGVERAIEIVKKSIKKSKTSSPILEKTRKIIMMDIQYKTNSFQ